MALAQYELRNVVATLGTATTPNHAELLFRAAERVIYCFDGDEAGRKAAWRALEATLPKLGEGLQARFLFLPEGEDPDSLVRKQGKEAFEALLNDAQPLSDFLFDHFTAQVDIQSLDGRASRPAPAPTSLPARDALQLWERRWIEQLLATHGGNLSRAARAAQMGRSHLRELARRHALLASDRDDDDHQHRRQRAGDHHDSGRAGGQGDSRYDAGHHAHAFGHRR